MADGVAVVEVGGIGYRLRVPLFSAETLRGRSRAHLFTTLRVRDDQVHLYGFATIEERSVFERLCTISGIGPGTALAILSGIPIQEFRNAVSAGQVKVLERSKGIGRKTAQRVILELKEILVLNDEGESLARWTPLGEDAVSALMALGFPQGHAEPAVRKALETLPQESPLEEVIRAATRTARSPRVR